VVETVCVMWFSVEFVMRLVACPSKRQFGLDVMNMFDILAIIPYFVVLAVQQTEGNCETAKRSGTFVIIRVLRIFRIFKLSKHSQVLLTSHFNGSVLGHVIAVPAVMYTACHSANILNRLSTPMAANIKRGLLHWRRTFRAYDVKMM